MRAFKILSLVIIALLAGATAQPTAAQEIGFLEDYVLSKDREAALKTLVPGTEAYYYYHCLHYQNTQQLDQVDAMLPNWKKRIGESNLYRQILNRQMLLKYSGDPQTTLDYLTRQLSLNFNHQREIPQAQRNLASQLDADFLNTDKLLQQALNHSGLERVTNAGLWLLVGKDLNRNQRRQLLQRLDRPEFPGLVQLIDAELKERDAQPFGSIAIHNQLTQAQLDQLLQLRPDLKNESAFVNAYLSTLVPSNDVAWQLDPEQHEEYLDRLWAFVQTLAPSFNSLKANVLYRKLDFDRQQETYNRDLFLQYLQLPRNVFYVKPELIRDVRSQSHLVQLGSNYFQQIRIPPIGTDQGLVQEYLQHFLRDADNYQAFEPYVRDAFLKQQFAEAKILAGIGDVEKWASLLSPDQYKTLLDRVDLEFAATNPEKFAVADDVKLDLYVKNVDKLIVKVFEINTGNYYREFGRQIDTDINLDGLVPNFEKTYEYQTPPAIQTRRSFSFPELDKRGVYVIDFIAGGQSSRALVRKGGLEMIEQLTAAGHRFTVIDENAEPVKQASLWISGQRYNADEDGKIQVPFSTQPGEVRAVITAGDFSSLERFYHHAESYQLNAALVLDRESMTRSNKAKILIRPSLVVGGVAPSSVELLEKQQLLITSVNQDGVSANQTLNNFELNDKQETICEFVVPPRTRSISLTLSAEIKNISTGQTNQLTTSRSFEINQIDKSDHIQDVHLLPASDGYYLEVLGKSGEARPSQAVRVAFHVDAFTEPVYADLQSDDRGRIALGSLQGVRSIDVNPTRGQNKSWAIKIQDQTYHRAIHVATDQVIEIPAPPGVNQAERAFVSLLEVRSGRFVKDWFDAVKINKGLVTISGLKQGDYELRLREPVTSADGHFNHDILIRVSDGQVAAGALVSPARHLELGNDQRVQVSTIAGNGDKIRVELENAGPNTRVHVIASRYLPAFSAYREMATLSQFEPWMRKPANHRSVYIEGRKIGEEYEYILRRKYAMKFPGNLLRRPSLLLNPWAVRETQNEAQDANEGDQFGGSGAADGGMAGRDKDEANRTGGTSDFANLDFLGEGSVLLANLKPNDAGVVTIDREQLGDGQFIRVLAVNEFETVQRNIRLELPVLDPRDARLVKAFNPEQHFAQSKQTELLTDGQTIKIDDLVSAKFQQYDDLADAFTLLQALGNHPNLEKFQFILEWNEKSDEQQRSLYSEFACHELNFFLYQKDPEFFKSVVQPHLKNKRVKTFVDRYLLDEDVSIYAEPWHFARLNTVERILLAQRLEAQRRDIIRRINETYVVSPTPRDTIDRLYDTSFYALGLDATRSEVEKFRYKQSELRAETKSLPELAMEVAEEQPSSSAGRPSHGRFGGGGGGLGGGGFGGRAFNAPAAPPSPGQAGTDLYFSGRTEGLVQNGKQMARSGEVLLVERMDDSENGAGAVMDGLSLGDVEQLSRRSDFNQLGGVEIDVKQLQQLRSELRRLYRRLEPTQEWIENNYYLLTPDQTTPELVQINQFWRDYANHESGIFLSPHFAESHRTFTEAMFALAVLDLPMKAPENDLEFVDNSMSFTAGGPTIVLHQQVRDAVFNRGNTKILVSENFFQKNDRYRFEDDVRYDKFVTDEFLAHTLYGGQVVITNPTSTPRAVDLLIQIPAGSVACSGSQDTRTIQLDLDAFSTKTYEYYFYFPTAGNFNHYPAHVSAKEQVLAVADPTGFQVVDRQAEVDKQSWEFVSQNGTDDQVIDFLNNNNVLRLNLNKIAFRMKDKRFFTLALNVLRSRYVFDATLWSYGIKHNDVEAIVEYLQHDNPITTNCGIAFESPLLTIDPVERNWYGHKEYWPLVNARSHQLGPQRKILNPDFHAQYMQLLEVLAQRRELSNDDHLVMTYYLLLQDRIEAALEHFSEVSKEELDAKIQYDYCDAYLDFFREQPEAAARKAAVWADYPVDHWRKRFQAVLAQVDEIKGGQTTDSDQDDTVEQQTKLAADSEAIELEVASGVATLSYQNLKSVQVNFYEMDIELLFSRSPFAQDDLDGFSMIRPNESTRLELETDDQGKGSRTLELPDSMKNKNVLIEVVAGDQVRSEPYYAHSLDVKLVEKYGQLSVANKETGKALPKTYVKVYARMADGTERFHKDGYTDLRGRFDYVTQSNRSMDGIKTFSILVLSESNGAVIKQAEPPLE